jgi:putative oxidoreductase
LCPAIAPFPATSVGSSPDSGLSGQNGMKFLNLLMGRPTGWEWVGILVARSAVGLLFFLSGSGKLFRADRRELMLRTIREAGIPLPQFNVAFVSFVEFAFGLLLIVGAMTRLSCVMLAGVMIVAIATTRIRSLNASSPVDWLSDFLYLPEVLYLVILAWLFLAGPGWLSIDQRFTR